MRSAFKQHSDTKNKEEKEAQAKLCTEKILCKNKQER